MIVNSVKIQKLRFNIKILTKYYIVVKIRKYVLSEQQYICVLYKYECVIFGIA